MNARIVIVIPVYNEATVIGEVLAEIRKTGNFSIIVVDDGSRDDSFVQASARGALALRHRINRGKGAAVKTGIMAANLLEPDIVVTMDGDGQHDPADLSVLVQPILDGIADVVLGSRTLNRHEMPKTKVVANFFGNFFTWLLYGIWVSDSQSGFRAYSKYAALIIDTKADKYEYDSKVIREIKTNRLKYAEVPVRTRYTEYSQGKGQKQGLVNGLITLFRMIWNMLT
ncbi:MAG: glycosyltransferase family 2 protein [Desulfofustis sp.]|nr:glycosyltransferase family 2 protein [Desulfofustis sp.]